MPHVDEFQHKLRRLYHHHYQQNIKALAADIGVDRSTVSRWLSGSGGPNKQDREAVFRLYERKEADADEELQRDLHKALRANDSELYRRLRDRFSGPPEDEPNEDVVDGLKEIYRRIMRENGPLPISGWHANMMMLAGGVAALLKGLWDHVKSSGNAADPGARGP